MAIPFMQYEMVPHRPGEVVDQSKQRLTTPGQITDKLFGALFTKVRSAEKKATARRIRIPITAPTDKFIKSILAGTRESPMRMQTAAADESWFKKMKQLQGTH